MPGPTIDADMFDRVARTCERFAVRQPADATWSELVRDALTLQHTSLRDPVRAQARAQLRRMCAALNPAARRHHRLVAGVVAERARRVALLHEACPGDPTHAVTTAVDVFDTLGAAGPGEDADVSTERAIALWVTARWANDVAAEELAQVFLDESASAVDVTRAARQLGGARAWISVMADRRADDTRRLLSAHPDLLRVRDRLLELGRTPVAELASLEELARRRPAAGGGVCWCGADPQGVATTLWGDDLLCEWRTSDLDAQGRDVVDRCAARAPNSLLRVEDQIMPLDPQGYVDGLLLGLLSQLPATAVKQWHEGAVADAFRKCLTPYGAVRTNVPWVTDPARARWHDGEFDVLATVDDLVVDVQAKASSSGRGERRDNRVYAEALEQHERAARALADGVWLVGTRERPRPPQVLAVHGGSVHVPVSVGLEESRELTVGGGACDPTALTRVVTTLDHVRLVAELVPPVFRVVYWVDRLAQEQVPLRFVNEVDYLDRWLRRLHGRDVALRTVKGVVLAEQNLVEHYLVLRNTTSGLRRPPFALTHLEREARAAIDRHSRLRASSVVQAALTAVARARVPGWVALAGAVSRLDVSTADERLRRLGHVSLPAGTWGLGPAASPRRLDGSTSADHRVTLARTPRGGWSIEVTTAAAAG